LHGKEKCSPKLISLKTLIDLFRHLSHHNFTVFSVNFYCIWQSVLIMEPRFVPSSPNT
jgi:hypothetical protein